MCSIIRKVNSTSCILKAMVNPSQSSSNKANEAWIAVKSDGQIISVHCKCMAGYFLFVCLLFFCKK